MAKEKEFLRIDLILHLRTTLKTRLFASKRRYWSTALLGHMRAVQAITYLQRQK